MQQWVRGDGPVQGAVTVLGFAVPSARSDPERERGALCSAALLAAPWERSLSVTGKDAARFLHALLTQDILGLPLGDSRPAALATRKGHVLADLFVYRQEDTRFRLRLAAFCVAETVALFERHRIAERVEWRLDPEEPACFLLVGPDAASRLETGSAPAGGGALSDCGENAYWMRAMELTAEDRFLVTAPTAASTLRHRLGVPEIGWAAFDRARIERGRAWWGIDADPERLVPEPGWDDRISYSKGCYLGQETLARLRYLGQRNWSLSRFSIRDGGSVSPGSDVCDPAGVRVGWITSSVARERDQLALGYLHRKQHENPSELRLPDGRAVVVVEATDSAER